MCKFQIYLRFLLVNIWVDFSLNQDFDSECRACRVIYPSFTPETHPCGRSEAIIINMHLGMKPTRNDRCVQLRRVWQLLTSQSWWRRSEAVNLRWKDTQMCFYRTSCTAAAISSTLVRFTPPLTCADKVLIGLDFFPVKNTDIMEQQEKQKPSAVIVRVYGKRSESCLT